MESCIFCIEEYSAQSSLLVKVNEKIGRKFALERFSAICLGLDNVECGWLGVVEQDQLN